MTAQDLRQQRISAGIPGKLLCARARVDRSRLCHLERGYVQATDEELARIGQALEELILAKRRVIAVAAECGWPVGAL
jgi:predicted transcriptional regulator